MPNHSTHVQHTLETYGVCAEDLHEWIDFPVTLFGPGHRDIRHNLKFIPQGFIDKYGKEMCKNIILDHLVLDKKKDQNTKYKRSSGYTIVAVDKGTAHIPDILFYNLEIEHPKYTESRRAEIPYLICPDIVLLYNPERFDKLIDNLKLLLARLLLKRGNPDEVRQMLSEGLTSDTTGKVASQSFPPYLPTDATPDRVPQRKGRASLLQTHLDPDSSP